MMKRIANILFSGKALLKCLLLLGLSLIACPLKANTDNSVQQEEDSLLAILSNTQNNTRKIELLRDLITLSDFTPKEAYYSKQMLDIANKIDSIQISYEAISKLSRYYSNAFQLDSLIYWVHTLDSITIARNETPKELLASHSALCRLYLIRGEYEAAMNEAVKQQIIVERTGDQLGLAYCNEYWGLIYMSTARHEEAADAFENSISILSKIEGKLAGQLQVRNNLVRTYMYLKDYEKAEKALDDYERELTEMEHSDDFNYKTMWKDDFHVMLNSFRIWLYAEKNMPQEAKEAMKSLKPYESELTMSYMTTIFHIGMASYYYTIKDYANAYEYINKPIDKDILYFQRKIEILTAMNKEKEVMEVYQDYLEHGKAKRKLSYTRQIEQLQNLQKIGDQEKAEQDLVMQEKELQNKHSQLKILAILSLILLVSLAFWILNLLRTKRLKNDLLKEQFVLQGISQDLQVAKEKAEKAERMKSNFIANISHEIRTPLNTIVGFVGMLKGSDQEERVEHIQIINNSSDLLLNLVSDVLNLSRLSDDDFVLNIQRVDLEKCCMHALSTIKHTVSSEVKVLFTHPEKPLEIDTDPLRLQQLLINLLGNAAKFTEKGEIILDYKTDQTGRSVIFSVTDTGSGIPLEKQELIFKRFEKASEIKQGSGLGLSICQAIAGHFAGHLSIDSSYTDGARFVFVMPISSTTVSDV